MAYASGSDVIFSRVILSLLEKSWTIFIIGCLQHRAPKSLSDGCKLTFEQFTQF